MATKKRATAESERKVIVEYLRRYAVDQSRPCEAEVKNPALGTVEIRYARARTMALMLHAANAIADGEHQ
jgi:hypothetical protein